MVLAMGQTPSRAEQQIINFFVNGGGFYDHTGAVPAGTGHTGCCYSYVGPAQSGTPGFTSTPTNTHPAVTFPTTSSGNGAISEASNRSNIGTKGHAVAGMTANDAYDGFGGVGLLGSSNFGGLTVTRMTDVTHGPTNGVVTPIQSAFSNAGVPNAARFVETLTNNTGSTINGTFGFFNNLGSDSNTLFVATSNGALTPASPHSATGQLWITSIQNSTGGSDPVITVVLGNNNYTKTQVQATNGSLVGAYVNGDDNPAYLYPVTVAPGQTVRIVLFSVLTADINFNANAVPGNPTASMQSDITLGGQMANLITNNGNPLSLNSPFFVGLTQAELQTIINFDFSSTMAFTQQGSNVNQNNVVTALNNVLNSGGSIDGLSVLIGLSGQQFNDALSLLAGEDATGIQSAGFDSMNAFLAMLLNPFNQGRNGNVTGGGGSSAYAEAKKTKASPTHDEAMRAFAKALKNPEPSFEQRWTTWGGAYGGYASANGNATLGTADTSTRTYGFGAGADYRVNANTTIGFSLAGGGTHWSLAQGRGDGRTDVFQDGMFARYTSGAWYVALAGAVGAHDVTTDRTVTIAGVTGAYDASFRALSYGGRGEVGYRFDVMRLGITPYAAIQAQALRLPSYSERVKSGTGAFALSYASDTVSDTRTELGAWFDYHMPLGVVFTRAAWAHDSNTDRRASATFQTVPGASFVVNGASPAADVALLTAGARFDLTNDWALTAKVDGEFGAGSRTYAANATLRKTW